MRLDRKGSQVQWPQKTPVRTILLKKPLQLYTNTLPWDICPRLFVQPQNNTTLDVDPVAKNCCFKMSYVIHLIRAYKKKKLPWPLPLWSWSSSTMAHRFPQQYSSVPNKYHSLSETLSVTQIDRVITNILLHFKVFCWNINILLWNQKKC